MKKIEIDKSRPVRFEEFCADNCVPSKRYVRTTTILAVPCYNSKQQECKQRFFLNYILYMCTGTSGVQNTQIDFTLLFLLRSPLVCFKILCEHLFVFFFYFFSLCAVPAAAATAAAMPPYFDGYTPSATSFPFSVPSSNMNSFPTIF